MAELNLIDSHSSITSFNRVAACAIKPNNVKWLCVNSCCCTSFHFPYYNCLYSVIVLPECIMYNKRMVIIIGDIISTPSFQLDLRRKDKCCGHRGFYKQLGWLFMMFQLILHTLMKSMQADLVLLMASLLLTHIFGQFCTDGSVCTAIFTPVCIMQACPDLSMLMLIDVSIKEFICSVEVRGTLSSSVGDSSLKVMIQSYS